MAADNEVWGIARFTDAKAREGLEQAGIRCRTVNLAANAESVGLLMAHCRDAKAFLHASSAAVYDPPDDEPRTERTALGDNHESVFPTYSISKIAGEVVARSMAGFSACPPSSRGSTCRTATMAAGRSTRWR